MKISLSKQLNNKKLPYFIVYLVIALGLTIFLIVTQADVTKVISLIGLLIVLPFFFINSKTGLIALLIVRPIMDIISEYTILSIQNISINLSSVLGIFIFVWGVVIILRNRTKVHKLPLFWPFLVFLVISALSTISAESVSASISELIKLSNILIIYILVFDWIKTKKDFNSLIKIIPLTIIVPAAVAVYQLIFNMGLNFGGLSNRLYGTFGHPNAFAYYLVLIIAVVIIYFSLQFKQRGGQEKERWPAVLLIIVFIVLLLFTYTRGAWIALAVFLFIIGILKFRKQLVIGLVIVGVIAGIYALLDNFLVNQYQYDLQERVPLVSRITSKNEEADSWDWRLQMYQEMAPLIWERPILGNGLGSFTLIRDRESTNPYEALEAHNDYLRLSIETGLLGLAAYLVMIVLILKHLIALIIYCKKNKPEYFLWSIGLLGLALAFYIASFADNLLRGTAMQWTFWALLAATLSIKKLK